MSLLSTHTLAERACVFALRTAVALQSVRAPTRHSDTQAMLPLQVWCFACAFLFLQVPAQRDVEQQALAELTENLIERPAFHQLRTVEQIGYCVWTYQSPRGGVPHLAFLMQSTALGGREMEGRVDAFLAQWAATFEVCSPRAACLACACLPGPVGRHLSGVLFSCRVPLLCVPSSLMPAQLYVPWCVAPSVPLATSRLAMVFTMVFGHGPHRVPSHRAPSCRVPSHRVPSHSTPISRRSG